MKKHVVYLIVLSIFCTSLVPISAIEPDITVQAPKSRLASLKKQLNSGLKRLKEAVTINDVETQRIVVKELFGIFRLLLYAIGIGALIKYGLPFVLQEIDVRTKEFVEGVDVRIQGIAEALDSRVKAITREADARIAKINKEVKKQVKAVTEDVDIRVQGMAEAVDSRVNAITREADARIAKINKEAFEVIRKLKEELHGTSIVGPGGIQYFGIHAPTKEQSSQGEPSIQQKPEQSVEYLGHH